MLYEVITTPLIDLKNLSPAELEAFLAGLGKERFRAGQLLRWIYKRGVTDFALMTDLAKEFRAELATRAMVSSFAAERNNFV